MLLDQVGIAAVVNDGLVQPVWKVLFRLTNEDFLPLIDLGSIGNLNIDQVDRIDDGSVLDLCHYQAPRIGM